MGRAVICHIDSICKDAPMPLEPSRSVVPESGVSDKSASPWSSDGDDAAVSDIIVIITAQNEVSGPFVLVETSIPTLAEILLVIARDRLPKLLIECRTEPRNVTNLC